MSSLMRKEALLSTCDFRQNATSTRYGSGWPTLALPPHSQDPEIRVWKSGIAPEKLTFTSLPQLVSPDFWHAFEDKINRTMLSTERPRTLPSPSSTIPFRRDSDFVDRGTILNQLHEKCASPASRTALVGLGGVG